jgi:hypothetical protein
MTQPSNRLAVHFSTKPARSGWGVAVVTVQDGKFGVQVISPVNGRPTAYTFAYADTESEARALANREWTGIGL